jgi:hypothetical protein
MEAKRIHIFFTNELLQIVPIGFMLETDSRGRLPEWLPAGSTVACRMETSTFPCKREDMPSSLCDMRKIYRAHSKITSMYRTYICIFLAQNIITQQNMCRYLDTFHFDPHSPTFLSFFKCHFLLHQCVNRCPVRNWKPLFK